MLFHVNKQSPDTTGGVHIGKDDLDDGAQENHCLDRVVDVPIVKQRTVGFEHQPRISRISDEVDVPVSPGRLRPRKQVQKHRQHEHNKLNKPQQQAEQTMQARQREKGEKGQEERERGERGKKEKGREAAEEIDEEVKKDVTGWTVVTRNKREKRKMIQIFVNDGGESDRRQSRRRVEANPERRGCVCDNARESAKEKRKTEVLRS